MKTLRKMETTTTYNHDLIARMYVRMSDCILRFIASRVDRLEDAENLAQDVWLRLLTYGERLEEKTLGSLIYTVARNIVKDYIRRGYRWREVRAEISREPESESAESPDTIMSAKEISEFERRRVECLPQQRRIIYQKSRYEDMAVADIAAELNLSFRTVENHLRLGRKEIRGFIAAIA